jgi:hypothetical protein
VAVLVCSLAGYAQGWNGRGGFSNAYIIQNRDDNRYYAEGFRDGREDARMGRSYHTRSFGFDDRDDRDAYQAGYSAGFNQETAALNGYAPRPRYEGEAVAVVPYASPSGNSAYGIGFRDGLRHGASDRSTGHSYRPTKDGDWRDADRGYVSALGSKQAYKEMYRSGYEAGYDRGFRDR